MNRLFGLTTLLVLFASTANGFVAPGRSASVNIGRPANLSGFEKERSFNSKFYMASDSGEEKKSNLPFWLDIGTKGGAVFYSLVLFIVPLIGYNIVTGIFGFDELEAGKWIGVGFTAIATFAWVSTYIFRVATKDMTYVSLSP